MSKPINNDKNDGPKDQTNSSPKQPENWPDVPTDSSVEESGGDDVSRTDQMRHADESDSVSSSTTDTAEGTTGYTETLAEEESERGDLL